MSRTSKRATKTKAKSTAVAAPPATEPTWEQKIRLEELAVQKAEAETERAKCIAAAAKRGAPSDSDDDDAGGHSGSSRTRARASSPTAKPRGDNARAGRRDERDVQTAKGDAAGIVDDLHQRMLEKFRQTSAAQLDKLEARFKEVQGATDEQLDATRNQSRELRRAIADAKTADKDDARERAMDNLQELIVEHAEGTRHLALQALKRVAAAIKAVAACTGTGPRARADHRDRSRSPPRGRHRHRKRDRSRSRSPRERSGSRERRPLRCFDCFREGELCPALCLPAVRYAPRDAWCAIDTARRCRRPRGARYVDVH